MSSIPDSSEYIRDNGGGVDVREGGGCGAGTGANGVGFDGDRVGGRVSVSGAGSDRVRRAPPLGVHAGV
jgi:hypothetical protein